MSAVPQRTFFHTDWSRLLRRNRALVVVGVAVATVCVPLIPHKRFIPLLKLEQALIDFRFRLRGNVAPSPDCVIVGINSSSLNPSNFDPGDVAKSEALQLMQQSFPWNRKVYALLLDKLFEGGARAVVLDFLFLNKGEGDEDFAAALNKYGDRVVIGSMFAEEDPDTTKDYQVYRKPYAMLTAATKERVVGCTALPMELDGVIRRTWYYTSEMEQDGYADDSRDIISMAGLGVTKFKPQVTLPDGTHLINFQGPATTYPYLPIEEIFMDRIFTKDRTFDFGKVFKDKIVFVGPVAETFHDVHNTPYGLMPGLEIHAQIAGSILKGSTLRDPPDWLGLALSIPMALLAVWACLRMKHALALSGVLAGGMVAYAVGAQFMFVKGGMLIPMVMPEIAFGGPTIFGLVFNFLLEQMEKARIRSMLDRLVSRNVAELVLTERDEFEKALLGQKRRVTVLFSDIRGFTTITEAANPENLVEQLNEYFYRMVDSVLKAEGTLQQFIGDAIMAIWGNTRHVDPVEGARQAIRTALAMSAALDELNAAWGKNPARLELRIGVGINHGEVIVGLLGHPQRMEFTTIGDGINTAARLETATRQFGCMILVGEAVEELTRNEFHYRRVGSVKFKGKLNAIEVYTPLGDVRSACPAWLKGHNDAVMLYRGRKFDEAYTAFEAVRSEIGHEDRLCEMYLSVCKSNLAEPPGEDWDDAWTLTEK
jgi:adenylate cyclase